MIFRRIGDAVRFVRWLSPACLLGLCVGASAAEVDPRLHLTVIENATTVFSKARDGCDSIDIPDAPARAIRVATGGVQLYATHFHNRRMTGPDLRHLSNDCRVVFQGAERDDPAAFDDRAWIASLYTPDGRTIFAAVHNEFQGHRRPTLCPSGRYIDCWYNAITAAVSLNGGLVFTRMTTGADLVAALPYRYDEVTGHHRGYFNPSNMVLDDGMLFMTVFATEAGLQKPGNCLLRTEQIANQTAWRAWDGTGFDATFIDPYNTFSSKDVHVCTPVGSGKLRWPVTSLVRHAPTGLFIALMMNTAHNGGVFYATSRNLIDWSVPVKLMSALGEATYRCGDEPPVAYPSLLDADSSDRNFMTIGDSAELFLTQFNITNCRTSMDRDLIRIPVTVAIGRD